jgi:hypothetical protein
LWAGAPDQLIEGNRLTLNDGLPILVDKVVVRGKLIIKIACRHAYPVRPERPVILSMIRSEAARA